MGQRWIGSTDVNHMLTVIGGWHVGCENEREAQAAVQFAFANGWLTFRMHYAPMIREGALAYELTDDGIFYLRCTVGDDAGYKAEAMRHWYRANARRSKLPS